MRQASRGVTVGLPADFVRYIVSAALGNLVLPIFSLFVPLLAVQLGADVFQLGLVGGAANIVYSFMPFVMGRFSDKGELRKFFVTAAFALLSVVSVLYFYASSPVELILLRAVEGLGWAMLWPSLESALTHDTQMDLRKTLAIFNCSWSSSAAVGPILGSMLVVLLSLREAFLASSLFLVAALALNLASYRKHKLEPPKQEPSLERSLVASGVKEDSVVIEKGTPVHIGFYMAAMALCAVCSGILFAFFSPYATSLGVSITAIGIISFFYGFCRFIVYLATIRERPRLYLLGKNRRIRNMFLSLIAATLATALVVLPDRAGTLYFFSFGILGLAFSIIYSISLVAVLGESKPEKMGERAGMFESSIGIGAASGPVIAGLTSGNSLSAPFLIPALGLVPILGVMVLFRMKRGRTVA